MPLLSLVQVLQQKPSKYSHFRLGRSYVQEGTRLHVTKINFVWEMVAFSYSSWINILIRAANITLSEFNLEPGSP